MSTETFPTADFEIGDDLPRLEGIETTTCEMPEPARHGGGGMFVLNDEHRASTTIPFNPGTGRNLPDGSLYQHARAAAYAHEDDREHDPTKEKDRIVLARDYHVDGVPHAAVMTDSRWRAGKGEGDDYSPWWKYDLTLWPVDENGDVEWGRTPLEALSLKIQPQVAGLVDSRGESLSLPYGTGTLVHVQTTWVDQPDVMLERARALVGEVLGYEIDDAWIHPDSTRFWKAEGHHRFSGEFTDDVVHTIRQSTDLLARHAADVDDSATHAENRWLEAKVTTREWEQLGFPQLKVPILLKVYYTANVDRASFPFDQPKIEAALMGNPNGEKLHWDQWDAVMQALDEIMLSHLRWAGVTAGDLVADDRSDGPAAPPTEWEHPEGRRFWLKQHYESLVPDLYREATKPNTQLVYDILDCIRRHGTVTYEQLMEETGGAYRTVREHVSRLCEIGGEEPGILTKVQDACTFVAFSSRYFEEGANDALDQVNPDDTPEDREERAEERRKRRRERQEATDDETDQSESEDDESEQWRAFSQVPLTGEQLARALDEDYLIPEHVRIRIDKSPLFAGIG